jgi:hypothetical protein
MINNSPSRFGIAGDAGRRSERGITCIGLFLEQARKVDRIARGLHVRDVDMLPLVNRRRASLGLSLLERCDHALVIEHLVIRGTKNLSRRLHIGRVQEKGPRHTELAILRARLLEPVEVMNLLPEPTDRQLAGGTRCHDRT